MKGIYIKEPYTVTVEDVEEKKVGENEVRIQVKAAGICGSDIHVYKGLHPFRVPPVLIGHEVSGLVIEIGDKVQNIKVGDKVAVEPQKGCGKCEFCLKGEVNHCNNRLAPGINDWYGAMAENFIAPETSVFVLPSDMDYQIGALTEPLAVSVHAVRQAGVGIGDKVAVLGSGPIGLLTIAAAKEAGATTILASDVFDYCLESAKQLGATNTINIKNKQDWVKEINKEFEGFDKVLVAAGVPDILNQGISLLKKGGKLVTIAMFHEEQNIDVMQLQGEEKEVIGSFCYNWEDTKSAVNLLKESKIPYSTIITHSLPYTQASAGFEIVEKKLENSLKVLLTF